jgi:hypothetical protein
MDVERLHIMNSQNIRINSARSILVMNAKTSEMLPWSWAWTSCNDSRITYAWCKWLQNWHAARIWKTLRGAAQCGQKGTGSPGNNVHVSGMCGQFLAGWWHGQYHLSLGCNNFPPIILRFFHHHCIQDNYGSHNGSFQSVKMTEVWLLSFVYIYTGAT